MTATQENIDSFHRFATERLKNGSQDLSMDELYRQWRAAREEAETVASIQRGLDDAEAGRVRSLDEVDADIRQELGFPARDK